MLNASVVTDPFRRHLVLELDGSGSSRLELPDGPSDVHRVAETHTAVHDDTLAGHR